MFRVVNHNDTSEVVRINIKKTSNTTRKCTFPSCEEKNGLRKIPLTIRVKVMKLKRLYIPCRALACSHHYELSPWTTVVIEEIDISCFTAMQIEDMIDMLRTDCDKIDKCSNGKAICTLH